MKFRTTFPSSGKNKGKSPLYTKYKEASKVVQSAIIPIVLKVLGPDMKPPSGKAWADCLADIKEKYWSVWSSLRVKKSGKAMPAAWSEPFFECFLLFGGPHPQGKGFGDFCPGGHASNGSVISQGRASAREREAQAKKQKRDEGRSNFCSERKVSDTPATAIASTP